MHKSSRKRGISNVSHTDSDLDEPLRKRRKVEKKPTKWICSRCTLENEATAEKCVVCEIPQNYKEEDDEFDIINKNTLQKNDSEIISWGDDEDINLDNFDGTNIYPSSNNKDIETPSTINGLRYAECWVCVECQAMNRLLHTHTKYNMKCATCKAATYSPSTPIIKSFEWDHHSVAGAHSLPQTQADALEFYEKQKRAKYKTKGIQNKEGDILIMGMIHQHNVRALSTIHVVPEEVIRLILLFHGEFSYDGWDTFTNREAFEIDNGLTTCRRTEKHRGFWKNAFGMKEVASMGKMVRYQWTLIVLKMRNKDWEKEVIDSVIIGVIDAEGIAPNMGSTFTEYKDGWGVVGDGYKVTDGVYTKSEVLYTPSSQIRVCLQWIPLGSDNEEQCQLLVNGEVVYELDAERKYKLAVAMNSSEYAVQWVSFEKQEDVLKNPSIVP